LDNFPEKNPTFLLKQTSHFKLLVKFIMFANCECFYSSSLKADHEHFCQLSELASTLTFTPYSWPFF